MYQSPCDMPSYQEEHLQQMAIEKYAMDAREAISTICNPYFGIEFGKLLAYSLKDGAEEATIICQAIGIGEREMAALINDKEWFDEVIYEF